MKLDKSKNKITSLRCRFQMLDSMSLDFTDYIVQLTVWRFWNIQI